MNKNKKFNSFILFIPYIFVFVLILDNSMEYGLIPRLVTRFCYNSPNPTTVNLLGCTGSSALTINITAAQAFCVISNCLGQIRQSPQFLGRKKRSYDIKADEKTIEKVNNIEDELKKLNQNKTDDEFDVVYKFNNDEQPFIIAKQVEVLIIDLPEAIEDSVLSVG